MKLPHPFKTPHTLRLGHVHLRVRALKLSVPFYNLTLGLRLTECAGRYAFLAADQEHHSISLEEIGPTPGSPSRRSAGIAHFAFEVPNRAIFSRMHRKLLAANIPVVALDHGISWTMQLMDPDGNEIEIFLDRRRAPGGAMLWKGRPPERLDLEHKTETITPEAAGLSRGSQRLRDRHDEGKYW